MEKQKYICITKCPELDDEGIKHCVATLEERREREEQHLDYCPCGNQDKWVEYSEVE